MKIKINRILKISAISVFFIALLMNVKLTLTDPFVTISNDALAQSTSSSSNEDGCNSKTTCSDGGSIGCHGDETCSVVKGFSVTCDGRTTSC